ncbi:T9SS type B sorting domain-containing protein [Tenacibaculum crassostreae]|uniref:T9SS type B sorting domain-containing protein n=1 Tax=Tenacibaculum crassostreae TaxID=502683 RepID=UPI003894C582
MKKKILYFVFLFSLSFNAQNNDCWTLIHNNVDIYNGQYNNNEFPGYHDPETTDLKEINGGFLTTGQYNKQTFDSNDDNIYTNLEDKDGGYLAKHDYNGNLKWIAYTEKNTYSYRDIMFGSVEDKEGNIYVIGHSINGAFFDSKGTKLIFNNTTNNLYGGYIIKLNKDGEILWHIIINNIYSKKINIDDDGNILLSGDANIYNNNTFNFYLNEVITDNLSNFEIMGNNYNYVNRFVLKLNPDGKLLWYTGIKTSGPNSEFLIDIGSDKNNNIYVTGYCSSQAEIYSAGKTNNPDIITWSGYPTKTFLVKFDKDGQFLWKVKSLLNDHTSNGVQSWSMTVDEQGNSYITGSNDAHYNNSPNQIFENTDGTITSEKVGTFFIAKVDTNGVCKWIKGATQSYTGTGYKIIKSNDEIITIGTVRNFNSLSAEVTFLSSDGNHIKGSFHTDDYFLAIYDLNGNVKRIFSNGINNQRFFYQDRISGFFKDSNNNYYISRNIGFFINGPEGYENFGHIISANSTNRTDGTITKFNESCGIIIGNSINQNIPDLSFCDSTSFGNDTDGIIKLDLTQNQDKILINEPLSDYQISYYKDEDLTIEISNPKEYKNSVRKETIYVKVEHLSDPSKSGETSFIIEVNELPNIETFVSLKQCDNSDINGFSSFNLHEAKTKIISNPKDYTITFFEEKALAESNSPNSIQDITAYTNQIVSNDVIWARVENINGCFRISEINLTVSTTEIPSSFQKSFYKCDNGSNTSDGIASFDFSSVTQEVKDLFPPNQQLIITYYENQANALAEQNEITDVTNYKNTNSPNQQTIYIRVDNVINNDCLGLGAHITLNVDTVPIANTVVISPECDNDRDGLFAFDTSNIQNTIIGNQTNVTVSYTDEKGVALSSPLPNPFITASQTITARITNNNSQDPDGQCYDETAINFVVNKMPIANAVPVQEECDDDKDGVFAFDTSSIESIILENQIGLIVKYFDENNEALPSPLPNPFITPTQTIRVRVENPIYDICYDETTIDFIVREKPSVSVIDEDIICMDNNPKLQIGVEDLNTNYSYIWRDENNIVIDNSANTTITKGGKYTVVATSIYGCDSEKATITIKESSKSTIDINDIDVQDDSNNNFIKINTSNLGLDDYEFRLLDSNSNILVDYQKDPNFENLDGGNYIIEINDKDGCGSVFFEISLISFPNFFTPNADGKNDIWHIQGIGKSIYKSGTVRIYDRFGKTLKILTIDDAGWDGLYNGQKLPTNDYWFYAELITPQGNIVRKKGNFTLLSK